MKAVNHKCPNCLASLKYNPKEKNWKCEYCGGKFSLDELKKNEEKYKETKVDEKNKKDSKENLDVDEYYCQDCGAKIISDKNTAATFCVYCKNTAILKGRLTDKFEPSKVIPFCKNKDDAILAFKEVGKGKFLMPKEFTLEKNIQELTGIYIPFWLYSCCINAQVSGIGCKVRTWRRGDYQYTETSRYNVDRSGEFYFNSIPVDGSVRFNDAIMNSIEPFDYSSLCDFSPSYLSGFLAEKYDVESNDATKISKERAEQSCINELLSSINFNYSSFSPNVKNGTLINENVQYVLLPVWMVNIKYNEKLYTFAMNGQTGKMIGDIPYSKSKAVILWIVLFVVTFAIMCIFTYLI